MTRLDLPYRDDPPFKISLAQWSLHRELRAGKVDNLDFAVVAKTGFGIEAIEYVNSFFKDKAKDSKYLGEADQPSNTEPLGHQGQRRRVGAPGRADGA